MPKCATTRTNLKNTRPFSAYSSDRNEPNKREATASSKVISATNVYNGYDHSCQKTRKTEEFFNQSCLDLAKSLLGKLLVHQSNGRRLSGFIIETECYLGKNDAASHSFNGKQTPRNEPMFMIPGTSYVYSIYGMYFCFNISSKESGSCVLIRALEPYEGFEIMKVNRQARRKSPSKELKITDFCSGPSKLCQALNITKDCNKLYMPESDCFWVEEGIPICEENIVISKRIGIDSAGPESANKPLRFYVYGNPSVSVKDKKAEMQDNKL